MDPIPNIVSRPKHRRLLRLAAIGIVVVLVAVTYRYFWLAKPMGSGPAGPSVPREAFSQPWTERSVVLLGVGDSVTAGLGASRSDLSYFNRLVRNPPDEFDDMEGTLSLRRPAESGGEEHRRLGQQFVCSIWTGSKAWSRFPRAC